MVFGHITTKPVTHSSAPANDITESSARHGGQPTQNKATSYLADTNNKEAQLPLGRGKKTRTQNHKNDKTANRKAQHQMARGKTRLKDSLQHKTKADTVNRW